MPTPDKGKCPWQMIGENTTTDVWWCDKCGRVCDADYEIKDQPFPTAIDIDTLYCPDSGMVP